MITPNKRLISAHLTLCLFIAVSACTVSSGKHTTSEPLQADNISDIAHTATSLYEQLGGKGGVEKLSEQLIIQISNNQGLRERYAKSDIGRFHQMMQDFTCEIADGPCQYTGENMKKVHGGMNIRSSEFNALVEALIRAMDTLEIPIAAQNQLLAKLAALQPDVVGH